MCPKYGARATIKSTNREAKAHTAAASEPLDSRISIKKKRFGNNGNHSKTSLVKFLLRR